MRVAAASLAASPIGSVAVPMKSGACEYKAVSAPLAPISRTRRNSREIVDSAVTDNIDHASFNIHPSTNNEATGNKQSSRISSIRKVSTIIGSLIAAATTSTVPYTPSLPCVRRGAFATRPVLSNTCVIDRAKITLAPVGDWLSSSKMTIPSTKQLPAIAVDRCTPRTFRNTCLEIVAGSLVSKKLPAPESVTIPTPARRPNAVTNTSRSPLAPSRARATNISN